MDFLIKIDYEAIKRARNIAVELREEYLKTEAEKHKILVEDPFVIDLKGEELRTVKLNIIAKTQAELILEAKGKVKKIEAEVKQKIEDQVKLTGDLITGDNAAEFAIIQNGLISNLDELRDFAIKHINNAAFRSAVTKYAYEHFKGENPAVLREFEWIDKQNDIKEFIERIFGFIHSAVEVPNGYYALFCVESVEKEKDAYEFADPFWKLVADYHLTKNCE